MNLQLVTAAAQPFLASDVIGAAFVILGLVFALLWWRDREPGTDWFAGAWLLYGVWFASTPLQLLGKPYLEWSAWNVVLSLALLLWGIGLLVYMRPPAALLPRIRWLTLTPVAAAIAVPLLPAISDIQIPRALANLVVTSSFLSFGGLAWWSARREPGAGHRLIALLFWAVPGIAIALAASGVTGPLVRYCAVIPVFVLALTMLTTSMLRRRRALEAEVARRSTAEDEVMALNSTLEQRVQERTAQLQAANAELGQARDEALERRHALFVTQQAEERYRTLAEWTPEPITVYVDERVAYANQAALALFGAASAAELIGKPAMGLVHPDSHELVRARYAQITAHGGSLPLAPMRYCRLDGSAVDVEVKSTAVTFDGQPAVYAVARDITARLKAEAELDDYRIHLEELVLQRTADLTEAKASAEAANQAKGSFLAHMSHEIRTPMNAIIGMTGLALRSADLPPRVHAYLGKIDGAAESLLNIINDILDFSKIESGKLEIERGEFMLQDVLDKVTSVVGQSATRKDLEFLLGTSPGVPARLIGDPLRLGQVLINLCSNAIKFTDQGEIVVVTVKTEVVLAHQVQLRFSVRDTGIGMDESQIARLFRPFDQLDASTTRRHGGTGLGLVISKQLVEMMGGQIGVRSTPGRGSEFFFTLPLGVLDEDPAQAQGPDLSRLRILAVDDSANAREIFGDLLGAIGCRHAQVDGAAAALAELERAGADDPYQLALVDWKMPQDDGFALARQIGASAKIPAGLKLILVTAYGDQALAQRALAEGFVGYLAKPVGAPALMQAIDAALGSGQGSGEAAAWQPVPAAEWVTDDARKVTDAIRGRRILLVEDNEMNRIVAVDLLQGVAGAKVTEAQDGAQAVAYARAACEGGMHPFDIVLMDMQMPVMDGLEATVLMRAEAALAGLPIVGLTAHAMARDRQSCLAAGMNDVLVKPFEPADLFATIAKWLPATASVAAQPAADAAAPLSPHGSVSRELGLRRCLGREELYQRVVRRYLDTQQHDASQMRDAFERVDAGQMHSIAHSAISSSDTVGATLLPDLARRLQDAVTAAEHGRWPDLVDAFAQEHGRVIAALTAQAGRDT